MPYKVEFEIPPKVALGLATGALERVGGVIREAGSKKVVAWLREAGRLGDESGFARAAQLASGQAAQLASGGITSAATGMIGTLVTAHSHNLIMMRLGAIQRTLRLTSALGMLNLAIGAQTLIMMIARVQQLESKLEELHAAIRKEFQRDRKVDLDAALYYSKDIVESNDLDRKRGAAENAILPLLRSRNHQLHDFDDLLSNDVLSEEQVQLAQGLLLLAMQVDTTRIRCYLETEQLELANLRLKDCLKEYLNRTKKFVVLLLSEYPARYFHASTDDVDFMRYVRVEEWLRDKDDVLLDLVLEHRKHFWNGASIQSVAPSPALPFLPRAELTDHRDSLTQAECLIENFRRFEGHGIEVSTARLSKIAEWDTQSQSEEHDFSMLVDLRALARLSL